MTARIVITAAVLGVLFSTTALLASEPCRDALHGVPIPDCVRLRCCDDYCPKPAPCAKCVGRYCCDDYCPKSPPCAVNVRQFCCDDYCSKPFPCIFCPPCSTLKCPPPVRPATAAATTSPAQSQSTVR